MSHIKIRFRAFRHYFWMCCDQSFSRLAQFIQIEPCKERAERIVLRWDGSRAFVYSHKRLIVAMQPDQQFGQFKAALLAVRVAFDCRAVLGYCALEFARFSVQTRKHIVRSRIAWLKRNVSSEQFDSFLFVILLL